MINKAGNVVTASTDSVSYAVMEKGGNLDKYLNAPLVDGSSQLAWPITGYNYFLLRLNHHIGTCDRRKGAMSFIYNFYNSDIVSNIAKRLGYAVVPDYIRGVIIN